MYRKRRFATGVGAFAVILALVAPLVAIVLYLVEALIFLVIPLLGMHRARRNAPGYVGGRRKFSEILDTGFPILLLIVVFYAAVAVWLGRRSITLPMFFLAIGTLTGANGLGWINFSLTSDEVKILVEITLALLLFADSSTLQLHQLTVDALLPARLIFLALPLVIFLGGVLAFAFFPREGIGFALLIGAILAPTDAALGLPIFTNERVPVRIRRALNVESGLNDGVATPFVTLFTALAVAEVTQNLVLQLRNPPPATPDHGIHRGDWHGALTFRLDDVRLHPGYPLFTAFNPLALIYAILSLTLIRMLPVALSLIGTHFRGDTQLLMGWLGPRGLASVVFTLIAFESFQEIARPYGILFAIAGWTILLSVLLHGFSALPLARWYGNRLKTAPPSIPELLDVPDLAPRQNRFINLQRAPSPLADPSKQPD